MATKTLSKEEILDAIGSMSVIELADLIEAFKEKFNVTIAAPVAAAAAPAAAGEGGAAAGEEKTEFTVVLKDIGSKKIQVIKAVREVTSLGLKEAKELVDSAPSNVREDILKEEAEAIKAKLEEQGAVVELK
jgi:large subunit ribosomal protein L7/L12